VPRVPLYEGPQVRPTPIRAEQNIRAPGEAFGVGIGQAVQQAGQQMGQVATLIDRRAVEQGKEDAEARAFQAYTAASAQTQKLFYEGDSAIYNRRGGQAMGATNEAAVELKRIGEEQGSSLDSPYAKQQFDKLWARHQDTEMGGVARHEAGQRREFKDQVVAGVVATSQNQATLRYNDPSAVDEQIGLAELAIRANTKGLPSEQVNAQVLTMRSGIHKAVTLRMATDSPLAAQQYYKDHADQFTADDNVALQRTLAPVVKRQEARAQAQDIIKTTTLEKSSAPSTLYEAQENQESGGKQFDKDGKPLTSSAGNYGVMQINDVSGKEAADALGIAWDPQKARTDAAYNRQLGRKYMDIQLAKYDGNRTLALAAYNAGGGTVDGWIKQFGDPRTGAITEEAWVAKLPVAETRQYIARINGRIGSSTSENVDLARASQLNDERNANDPEQHDMVTSYINAESSRREAIRRDREQQALTQAWQHVNSGGTVATLPPEVAANLPYGRTSDLEARERSLINGKNPPENSAEYERLTVLAATDPDKFKAEKATDWEKVLPREQVRHFVDLKGRLDQSDAKEMAKSADLRRGLGVSASLLKAAGIDTTPKEGSAGAVKYAAFGTALLTRMEEFKDKEGRKPTDAEIVTMSQDLLLPGRLSKDWWPDPEKRPFELTDEERSKFYVEFKNIPKTEKADITAKLGGRATNELVEKIYAAYRRNDRAAVQRLLGTTTTTTTTDTVPNPVN